MLFSKNDYLYTYIHTHLHTQFPHTFIWCLGNGPERNSQKKIHKLNILWVVRDEIGMRIKWGTFVFYQKNKWKVCAGVWMWV